MDKPNDLGCTNGGRNEKSRCNKMEWSENTRYLKLKNDVESGGQQHIQTKDVLFLKLALHQARVEI